MLHQLLGYVLLDYRDRYGLEEAGLYLARHRALIPLPLDEAMNELAPDGAPPLPELRARFREVVRDTLAS